MSVLERFAQPIPQQEKERGERFVQNGDVDVHLPSDGTLRGMVYWDMEKKIDSLLELFSLHPQRHASIEVWLRSGNSWCDPPWSAGNDVQGAKRNKLRVLGQDQLAEKICRADCVQNAVHFRHPPRRTETVSKTMEHRKSSRRARKAESPPADLAFRGYHA